VFEKFVVAGYDAESLDEWIPTFRQNSSGVLVTLEEDATYFCQPLVSIPPKACKLRQQFRLNSRERLRTERNVTSALIDIKTSKKE
jgi:hypothetical protein